MKRNIIRIDEEKCNGCGICIDACHEGALQLIDGKAKLVTDSYCDGLGACLPDCPTGALSIEKREADAFDEKAVQKHITENKQQPIPNLACGCPGTQAKSIEKKQAADPSAKPQDNISIGSQLRQWPCQIKLVPVNAPYLQNAHLLIAADCTAFAYGNIHNDFMKNKITLIGCPKLDNVDYSEKLTDILTHNNIKSITILRMEVPCCGGMVNAITAALKNSEKIIPWRVITISANGTIIED